MSEDIDTWTQRMLVAHDARARGLDDTATQRAFDRALRISNAKARR